MIIEIAVNSPTNRGIFVPKEQLSQYLQKYGKTTSVYQSVYLYTDALNDHLETHKSIKGYIGEMALSFIPIDIDKGDNSNENTLQQLHAILFRLQDEGMMEENCQIYFSGTGYHIYIHKDAFGFEPSSDLPYLLKETMKAFSDNIDLAVYKRGAIIRCVHTLNLKSNLYKIPLSWSEAISLTVEDILELAKVQRLDFVSEPIMADGELEHLRITEVPLVRELRDVTEPTTIVPCFQSMWRNGAEAGSRNNTILRMSSHLRRCGIPSEAAKIMMLHWNNNSLDEALVQEKVEYVYNAQYQYGCNDALLKKHCSPKCIHFKKKDYIIETYNSEDLQKVLEDRMDTSWNGKTIDLTKIFGVSPMLDAIIYPGELVTIFGSTGANKTALAQNIMLGLDMAKNVIRPELQIPTLFLSLELSAPVMHKRNLQIASDSSKEEVNKNFREIWAKNKQKLAHITIQTIAPSLKQIEDKIKELQPKCVIIDYIDLVELGNGSEYNQIRTVSHHLRSMAVNMDLIIIQIAQVSREYSRAEILDLYAGKGCGAIENASGKVIGIGGQASSPKRNVELFKNSDGDLLSVELHWTPSFRLLKD